MKENDELVEGTILYMEVLAHYINLLYQEDDSMDWDDAKNMAFKCGKELHNIVKTYTGRDIRDEILQE